MNTLELIVGAINSDVFLREFSFSRNQFRPSPGREVEFADQVVVLNDTLMVLQIKEKTGKGDGDRWFKAKVLGLGTKQVRATLGYLAQYDSIELTNNRGHTFAVRPSTLTQRVKAVVYHAAPQSPLMVVTRHHTSRTAGFIHVIQAVDYDRLCRVLVTPTEIMEYMAFREKVVSQHRTQMPDEKALVGQFLSGHFDAQPSARFAEMVDRLQEARPEWDLSHITSRFAEHLTTQIRTSGQPASETQYYNILSELALLNRVELKAFRERFDMCVAAARDGRFQTPLRMTTSRCGYLFLTVPPDRAEGRLKGLQNLMLASKHEQRLERHLGLVVCPKGSDLLIDWAYAAFPWHPDATLDERLKEMNPFRPLKAADVLRYRIEE
ncbi:MAG TPA: hypothetical protein VMU02_10180 [bacterium]|nr:hypothetical protein [bacterium]